MYLLLVFLPLLGFLNAGLFGRFMGPKGSSVLTVNCLLFSFFFSVFTFYEVALIGTNVYVNLAIWIDSESLNVDWGFLFDTLTVVMCCVVTFVSSLVHICSVEYIAHDPCLARFISYLSLFTFFMLILVTADNFVQMFVGWVGVRLCSYLLINFWFTRIQANKAAIKAIIINTVRYFNWKFFRNTPLFLVLVVLLNTTLFLKSLTNIYNICMEDIVLFLGGYV